jgi:hypothetical protein
VLTGFAPGNRLEELAKLHGTAVRNHIRRVWKQAQRNHLALALEKEMGEDFFIIPKKVRSNCVVETVLPIRFQDRTAAIMHVVEQRGMFRVYPNRCTILGGFAAPAAFAQHAFEAPGAHQQRCCDCYVESAAAARPTFLTSTRSLTLLLNTALKPLPSFRRWSCCPLWPP